MPSRNVKRRNYSLFFHRKAELAGSCPSHCPLPSPHETAFPQLWYLILNPWEPKMAEASSAGWTSADLTHPAAWPVSNWCFLGKTQKLLWQTHHSYSHSSHKKQVCAIAALPPHRSNRVIQARCHTEEFLSYEILHQLDESQFALPPPALNSAHNSWEICKQEAWRLGQLCRFRQWHSWLPLSSS